MESNYTTKESRKRALGSVPKDKEKYFEDVHFAPLKRPKPGEWLHSAKKESGQTFAQYKSVAPRSLKRTIYLQPLETIPSDLLEFLTNYCEAFFVGMEIRVLEKVSLTSLKVPFRHNGFKQYHALKIIQSLRVPRNGHCLLAITMQDLYPRESWNFVFGLAKGNKGVFSFARLNFEGVQELLWFRAAKTCTHELSHMFGLKHCIYYLCLMNGSNSLEESSSKPNYLCPVCLKKLYYCIGFNLKTRYDMLARVCNKPFELLQNQMQFYETMANL